MTSARRDATRASGERRASEGEPDDDDDADEEEEEEEEEEEDEIIAWCWTLCVRGGWVGWGGVVGGGQGCPHVLRVKIFTNSHKHM